MFFVSVDSKKLSHFVSLLFSTLTSKSTSVDSKGLALHQNCAKKSCFSFVFKRIRRGTLKWRDLIPRLTGRSARHRAGLPECDYTSGLLKVKRKRGSGSRVYQERVLLSFVPCAVILFDSTAEEVQVGFIHR